MLHFCGIEWKNGVPQRYQVTYNLTASLLIMVRMIDQAQSIQKQAQILLTQSGKNLLPKENTFGFQGKERTQYAQWSRAKDMFAFFSQPESTWLFKIKIAKTLLLPKEIHKKWDVIRSLIIDNKELLNLNLSLSSFKEPHSEINLLLRMIQLFFLEQDKELPPPNLKLRFTFGSFPLFFWEKTGKISDQTFQFWTPENPYCRLNFLSNDLIQTLFASTTAHSQNPALSSVTPDLPFIADAQPDSLVVQYNSPEDKTNSQQLVLIPESPQETLYGFQSMIQKKYGFTGLKHFLGIMMQLGKNSTSEIRIFDVTEHLNLVAQPSKTGVFNEKHSEMMHAILHEMTYLNIVRKWGHDSAAKETTNPLLLLLGEQKAFLSQAKNRSRILIDSNYKIRIFLDALFNPAHIGSISFGNALSLIPDNIFKENAKKHPLLLCLSAYLSGTWFFEFPYARGATEKSTEELLDGCAYNYSVSGKYRLILRLKQELHYMKEQNYIGELQFFKSKEHNQWKDRYRIKASPSGLKLLNFYYSSPAKLSSKEK